MKASILIVIGLHAMTWGVSGQVAQRAPLELVLTVPAYRLDVVLDGRVTRSYGVAVGDTRHPTPIGEFEIDQVTWNPWWYPPPGDWAADAVPIPPGPSNPMGSVKMRFRPYYYLHGTPEDGSIGHARSHGCVRMRNEDAVDLARLIHAASGTPLPAEISKRTRELWLVERIPLRITYTLAEVSEGRLRSFVDVYHRSQRTRLEEALAALHEAGYSSAVIDEERLGRLLDVADPAIDVALAEILSGR